MFTTKRYYSLGGIGVAVRDSAGSGSLDYLLGDQLGSTTVSVNSAGGTPVVQRYLPYGAPRSTTGGSAVTDRGWIGQTRDASTGLQYLNARYYDPVVGRFTATDPLADLNSPGTLDAYGYVGGSPVSAKDPSGLVGLPVYEEMQNIFVRYGQNYQKRVREGYYDRPEPRGLFAGFFNGFVALPIAALGVATDAINCGRGAGCGFDYSRNMQHGIAHTITNPTSIGRGCNADRTTCAGEFLGGLAFGGAAKRLLGPAGAAEFGATNSVDEVAGSEFLDDALRMNEQPLAGKGPPAPSPNFLEPTNPAQLPPGNLAPGHSIRPMGPTSQYPDGYWVETNAGGQPIDISTGRPPSNVTRAQARAMTHVPYPPR